jgi:hypothetical protein
VNRTYSKVLVSDHVSGHGRSGKTLLQMAEE